RVVQQAERGALELQVADLLLQRGDALCARRAHQHREEQKELRNLGYQRLQIQRALVGIDADGEEVEHALANVVADGIGRLVAGRQRATGGAREEVHVLTPLV